ncbi:MAG: hypothetical protein JXR64_09675 [Spirochaetales bacterium]|nr:hypothetical protein [Spirochaetales bacterium]
MKELENIKSRRSVRTFKPEGIDDKTLKVIQDIVSKKWVGPFGKSYNFTLINLNDENIKELGNLTSYGVIKGANLYLAGSSESDDRSIIDYGYCFEKIILDLNREGISTCWLGGTFGRGFVANALGLESGFIVPAITPIGIKEDKSSITEKLVRTIAQSNKRLDDEKIFFIVEDNLVLPAIWEGLNSKLKGLLEAVKYAPSASNKQPWRILVEFNAIHLFWDKNEKYNASMKNFNIQALDMGIALAHIDSVAKDEGLKGSFVEKYPDINESDWIYINSWVRYL